MQRTVTGITARCSAPPWSGATTPFGEKRIILAAFVAMVTFVSQPANAHPHVWVTSQTKVVYDKGSVLAVEQAWTFDEFYSSMAVQGLDTNNDGQYSHEELAELAKINMEGLKEFDYFTSGRLGDAKIAFGEPIAPHLDYTGGILTLNFRLPLKDPAPAKDFSFATFDPAFFIAFELAKENGVSLGGAPPSCSIALRDAEPSPPIPPGGAGQNGSLAGAFEQQFGGGTVISAKWASILCKNS